MSTTSSSPSSPGDLSSPSTSAPSSKLPRFMQKQTRDRSKSESVTISSPTEPSVLKQRSKFLSMNKKRKSIAPADDESSIQTLPIVVDPPPHHDDDDDDDSLGAIVAPVLRARAVSECPPPSTSAVQHVQTLYSSTSSGSARLGDLPTRLGGWLAHTFSASSNDLSLPAILAQHSPGSAREGSSSPRRITGPTALLAAAKHGKGTLDKAMRFLRDSDAVPDRCPDPIWLLGVRHPGWEPPTPDGLPLVLHRKEPKMKARRGSWRSSLGATESAPVLPTSGASTPPDPTLAWPPAFYADFTSRIWLTYRSHLASPIRDTRLVELEPCSPPDQLPHAHTQDSQESRNATPGRKVWPWAAEKTWTADSGWGCMVRTGQSLLANALIEVLLGRDWRRPPHPVATADYATYVRIITWFLDTPDPHAPFSVHRMALAGKELGTQVGQWFGPSIAAGAIKSLVNAFPECGLGVALAIDRTLYETDVFAASHGPTSRTPRRAQSGTWGTRPVLLLVGVRLGISGVNPIYYDSIKMLYTFPQSVGIAGGRPASSYYFVGSQADNLFYLDPHHARPAVPLRPPPPPHIQAQYTEQRRREEESAREGRRRALAGLQGDRTAPISSLRPQPPGSPTSVRSGASSSGFSYHTPASPSPLQHQVSGSSSDTQQTEDTDADADTAREADADGEDWEGAPEEDESRSPPPSYEQHGQHRFAGAAQGTGPAPPARKSSSAPPLDPMQLHYCNAYAAADLATFHCTRVRKMAVSALDPSMLLGFVVRDADDWQDLRRRVGELPRAIFAIADEPPTWPADVDDEMDLQSVSDEEGVEEDADEDEGEEAQPRPTEPPSSDEEHDSDAGERSHLPHRQPDSEAQRRSKEHRADDDATAAVADDAAPVDDDEDSEDDDHVPIASVPHARAAAERSTSVVEPSRGGSSARNVDRAYMDDVAYKPYTRAHPEGLVSFNPGKL